MPCPVNTLTILLNSFMYSSKQLQIHLHKILNTAENFYDAYQPNPYTWVNINNVLH